MAKMEERPGHPSVTVRVPGRFSVPPSPTDSDGKCAEALCSWGPFTPPLPVDARANVTGGAYSWHEEASGWRSVAHHMEAGALVAAVCPLGA